MAKTILPSGEELEVTPAEELRYLNPDGLRQLLRQERLRWQLKVNRDVDYSDKQTLYKYSGEIRNEGQYQKMEVRTFQDNGANAGYAGVFIDTGVRGIPHDFDKWDNAISDESLKAIVNRSFFGALATVKDKPGYGLDDNGKMSRSTDNRSAVIVADPYDGRLYALTSDSPTYQNNETRSADAKIPNRAVARIADVPTRMDQLVNDLNFIADPDYHHSENNFTNSNRYLLDNLDDKTFVYPEISKDKSGNYIKNIRIGLDGTPGYGESDGTVKQNTQPDYGIERAVINTGDRGTDALSSYNHNVDFSGVNTEPGFLQGVFRSVEELEKVDLLNQKQLPFSAANSTGARRHTNFYGMDGIWGSNWYDNTIQDSYLEDSLNPNNMTVQVGDQQPIPYEAKDISYVRSQLYQWRYNRVSIYYKDENISVNIVATGTDYVVGDVLRWTFGDASFLYQVDTVGADGQIMSGHYIHSEGKEYNQDPSTSGIGIEWYNTSGIGSGAKLSISASGSVKVNATQIKNNLFALVDITPTVRSDNTSEWSDVNLSDDQGGQITLRSTAAGPAFSGVNSGKGGPKTNPESSSIHLYEHGGNPTAGVHVHLFRYVINTQNPTWQIVNGVKVYTGAWVDQGPLGLERPCDIKALLLSNPDTNNFNNYYKFMLDLMFDTINRSPDGVETGNSLSLSQMYIHKDQVDPSDDTKFTIKQIDSTSGKIVEVDVTDKVLYINSATGVAFMYNEGYKNDPTYGYGYRGPGWFTIAGTVAK